MLTGTDARGAVDLPDGGRRVTMFGVMTILLAAMGIYGLVAYTVSRARRRSAPHGGRRQPRRRGQDFPSRGNVLAASARSSVWPRRGDGAIRSLLYGIGARDVISFGGGTAVVMTIAVAASL